MDDSMRIEVKGTFLGLAISACVLAATFGLAPVLQSTKAADSRREPQTGTNPAKVAGASDSGTEPGHKLFDRNCAHCHGDDARGDEGPNLHGLTLSDARIAKRIREGLKGEMPAFGKKLNDADIQALIAYIRTLKD
jgi:mono/diheme cytochrome c family protein